MILKNREKTLNYLFILMLTVFVLVSSLGANFAATITADNTGSNEDLINVVKAEVNTKEVNDLTVQNNTGRRNTMDSRDSRDSNNIDNTTNIIIIIAVVIVVAIVAFWIYRRNG